MGKDKNKVSLAFEPGTGEKTFNIFIDKSGKIHIPLDFPDKEGFVNSIPGLGISNKIKKSGGLCG